MWPPAEWGFALFPQPATIWDRPTCEFKARRLQLLGGGPSTCPPPGRGGYPCCLPSLQVLPVLSQPGVNVSEPCEPNWQE